jgi:hypothetical protein
VPATPSLLRAETFCPDVTRYSCIQLNGKRALEDVAVGLSPISTRTPPVDVYERMSDQQAEICNQSGR